MPSGDFHRNKTHCPAGHAYDEANTYWTKNRHKNIGRCCKECQKLRMQRKREKPEFKAREAAKMRRWRLEHPERIAPPRRKHREMLQKLLLVGCSRCSEKHIACLEFHHREPKLKGATISQLPDSWPMEKVLEEIAKCDILCANCHRKEHWNRRQKTS